MEVFQHQSLQTHEPKMADSTHPCIVRCITLLPWQRSAAALHAFLPLYHTSSLPILEVAIPGRDSTPGSVEGATRRQTYSCISQIWQPRETHAGNMEENFPTHGHKPDESVAIKQRGLVSV